MLDKSQSPSAYQELQKLLDKLKKNLSNGINYPEQITEIDQILPLLLNSTTEEQVSLVTEIHRELRLLKTELLFLSALKNSAKQTSKIQAIQERLTKISGFTELLS
ncbi:MAG: hypothetical protein EA365_03030 [Gloeocapsa sp. DLM2.Bin57]|nr:MAG: hypothetical protein EA365_03030 [Gloeocapsa sp. DLM2.Bin57]